MKKAIDKMNIYKELLAEEAVKFYCDEISDETIIGITGNKQFSWKEWKERTLNDANYKDSSWFKELKLTEYDQVLIHSLELAQEE